jgi:hypothetical protein
MRASNVMYEVDEGRRALLEAAPLQMLVTFFMVMLLAISAIASSPRAPLPSPSATRSGWAARP